MWRVSKKTGQASFSFGAALIIHRSILRRAQRSLCDISAVIVHVEQAYKTQGTTEDSNNLKRSLRGTLRLHRAPLSLRNAAHPMANLWSSSACRKLSMESFRPKYFSESPSCSTCTSNPPHGMGDCLAVGSLLELWFYQHATSSQIWQLLILGQ